MFQNKVVISGRAYRPQVRTTKSGKSITTFGLSVYNGKDANGKGTYCFIDCKVFKDMSSLTGDVLVDGKIAFDCWEKDGKKFTKPVIIVNSLQVGNEEPQNQNQETEFKDDTEIPW